MGCPGRSEATTWTGYAQLRSDGAAALTLDSSRMQGDVFARLLALDGVPGMGVRAVLVKAGDRFRLESVRPGRYEIWCLELESGLVTRSKPFVLTERDDGAAAHVSVFLTPGMPPETIASATQPW